MSDHPSHSPKKLKTEKPVNLESIPQLADIPGMNVISPEWSSGTVTPPDSSNQNCSTEPLTNQWNGLMTKIYSKLAKRSQQMYKEAITRINEACENEMTDYRDLLTAIMASETLLSTFIDDTQEIQELLFEDEYYTPSRLFKYTVRDSFVNSIVPRDRRVQKCKWRFKDHGFSQNDINVFHLRYHLRNFAAHCGISKSEGALKCDICRWAIFNIEHAMSGYFSAGDHLGFEEGLQMTCSEFLRLMVSEENGVKLFKMIVKVDFKVFSMFDRYRQVSMQMQSHQ